MPSTFKTAVIPFAIVNKDPYFVNRITLSELHGKVSDDGSISLRPRFKD
jgi:hypothetical protein